MQKSRKRRRAGLTLMEVMLVLVILGILGSMAALFLRGAQKQALIRTTQAEMAVFKTGLEAYQMNMFAYPQTQDGLQSLLNAPSNSTQWMGPYIEPNDLQDPWGNPYQYELVGTEGFVIISPGPDGAQGTEDDIRSDAQQQQQQR
jgi:general secretion pathway protein G